MDLSEHGNLETLTRVISVPFHACCTFAALSYFEMFIPGPLQAEAGRSKTGFVVKLCTWGNLIRFQMESENLKCFLNSSLHDRIPFFRNVPVDQSLPKRGQFQI